MRYLLHNIYGDADHLINTAPDDVTCVPFGWDADTEQARNSLLASLGLAGVSQLPCLLVEHDGVWHEVSMAGTTWEDVETFAPPVVEDESGNIDS